MNTRAYACTLMHAHLQMLVSASCLNLALVPSPEQMELEANTLCAPVGAAIYEAGLTRPFD